MTSHAVPLLTPIVKTLRSPDGTVIHAEAAGDRNKPAIVFLHGFSLSSVVFDPLFADPMWTDYAFLVKYDLRGHGRSGKPDDEAYWDSKRIADDFRVVVEAFDVKQTFIVAWSLGASHIVDILAYHPISSILGLINIAGLPYMDQDLIGRVGTPEVLSHVPALTQSEDREAFETAAEIFLNMCSPLYPLGLREACLAVVLTQPVPVTLWTLHRSHEKEALMDVGRKTNMPLLLLYGDRDLVMIGEELEKALTGWQNMKTIILEGGGHMPWLECSDVFREILFRWMGLQSDLINN